MDERARSGRFRGNIKISRTAKTVTARSPFFRLPLSKNDGIEDLSTSILDGNGAAAALLVPPSSR